jgi:hypothetical protein
MLLLRFFHYQIVESGSEIMANKWSSYDRVWFSGPDKQEVFIFILMANKKRKQQSTNGVFNGLHVYWTFCE